MFDSVLALFVRQLGSARFAVDRSTLTVRFATRPAVRVSLSSEEASSLVKAARDLANTVEATLVAVDAPPAVLAPVSSKQEPPLAEAKPSSKKSSKK